MSIGKKTFAPKYNETQWTKWNSFRCFFSPVLSTLNLFRSFSKDELAARTNYFRMLILCCKYGRSCRNKTNKFVNIGGNWNDCSAWSWWNEWSRRRKKKLSCLLYVVVLLYWKVAERKWENKMKKQRNWRYFYRIQNVSFLAWNKSLHVSDTPEDGKVLVHTRS